MSIDPSSDPASGFAVVCYSPAWRRVVAALIVAEQAGILWLLARIAFVDDPPMTFQALVALFVTLVGLPGALAAALARGFAARLAIEGDTLVIVRRDLRVAVPTGAITAVEPWSLPLPAPGAWFRLRSGRRLAYGCALADPQRVASWLRTRGSAPATRDDDPAFLHAAAAAGTGKRRWWHWVLMYPLFGVAPAAIMFNAHQFIAYGGTLGEYYQYGWQAYAGTWLEYWGTVTIYLVLWAGVWRMVGEAAAWLASRLLPAASGVARRVVEIGCRLLYYGGVPVMIALRFAS